jgi:hypothetical protein
VKNLQTQKVHQLGQQHDQPGARTGDQEDQQDKSNQYAAVLPGALHSAAPHINVGWIRVLAAVPDLRPAAALYILATGLADYLVFLEFDPTGWTDHFASLLQRRATR